MNYVLFSPTAGVYLGSCMGLGFWSAWDPAGQECACTFDSAAEAVAHMATWDGGPMADAVAHPVPDANDFFATIEQCVAAGLPRWDPAALPVVHS